MKPNTIKRIIHYEQVGFILGMQSCFKFVILLIENKKNNMISVHTHRHTHTTFDKIQI